MSGKDVLEKYWHWVFLCAAIIISLYLRIVNPWDSVFVSWMGVRFSGNDPWYYYRLVENCLANFPNRIWFDSFTYYPYGTYVHFGPFLVYLSAILSLIGGANSPEEVRSILAFVPAIAGTLLVFPVYLFTKEAFNKKAGVIAALLVVMIPGQLLHRSVLGFNDHHIWEVFWTVSALALFVYSINSWRGKEPHENIKDIKKIILPILTGLALGFYLLSWAPGFILALILVGYIFLVSVLKNYLDAEIENIYYIGTITFLTASIVYLPFSFKRPDLVSAHYSPFQLLILLSSVAMVLVFHSLAIFEKREYFGKFSTKNKHIFPISIIVILGIIASIISITFPNFINLILRIVHVVQPKGGALTVAEIQPFFSQMGEFSLAPAWGNFSITFFFAIPGMLFVAYKLFKERKNIHLLVMLWGVLMLIALAGQNRFAYYFGAVSAIFAATITDAILCRLKFYDVFTNYLTMGSESFKKVGTLKIATSLLVILLLFYPTFNDSNFQSKFAGGGMNKNWYDALVWMNENTPGKEFYDEYLLHDYPPRTSDVYQYPNETYGVMSWWDYGHWITAIAHRMPNANPFQQGIGNKYNEKPGAAPFFTAFNESEANAIADELGVKYVVSDVEMATGKFYAMATWAEGTLEEAGSIYYAGQGYVYSTPDGRIGIAPSQFQMPQNSQLITIMNVPSENYYNTMEARLHIFDGFGLKNYRLLYESKSTNTIEILYRLVYNNFYSQTLGYPPINATPTGYVKVFEYVPGAKITGKVSNDTEPNEPIILNLIIQTNQDRVYNYAQVTEPVNGTYSFTVPYAQETKYPVKPVSPYYVSIGNTTKTISITDDDVLNGNTITLDLT